MASRNDALRPNGLRIKRCVVKPDGIQLRAAKIGPMQINSRQLRTGKSRSGFVHQPELARRAARSCDLDRYRLDVIHLKTLQVEIVGEGLRRSGGVGRAREQRYPARHGWAPSEL